MARPSPFRWWFILLLILYAIASVTLFVYSFTQVDLALTLNQAGLWQQIQRSLQYIGFYQRPVSTILYVGIISLFFGLYACTLWIIQRIGISKRHLWYIIGVIVILLVLSYPAFSYDIFNYMFHAKLILHYHKNPYAVIPLEFTGVEPWLSFMRWTHLPAAYTPVWIAMTLPFYLFGFGYFLLILWNFKILVALFYIATIWMIAKVLEKISPKHVVLGMAIFALNPLTIIECLVSGHNDIAMMFFAVLAMYLYYQKKYWLSCLLLSASIATKLMTVFLLPIPFGKWRPKIVLLCMVISFIAVQFQREVLPWYLLWVLPFIALVPDIGSYTLIAGGASLGLLFRYAPYLYYGNWDGPVPQIKFWVSVIPVIICCLIVLLQKMKKHHIRQ